MGLVEDSGEFKVDFGRENEEIPAEIIPAEIIPAEIIPVDNLNITLNKIFNKIL